MRVCHFDDHVRSLEPFTLTRPAFDLYCGLTTLAEKTCRYFGATAHGVMLRPGLAELYRVTRPDVPCNDARWLGENITVLVNSRWLPPSGRPTFPDDSCLGLVDGEVAYAKLSAEQLRFVSVPNLLDQIDYWKTTLPTCEAGGTLFRRPWELVEANGKQIIEDFRGGLLGPSAVGSHVAVVGPREQLWIHPSAHIDPLVVADTRNGPVVIDRDACVQAFSRLEGPCYVGPQTQVLGAKIRAGVTLGPCCRVGGEVEASILQGHVNKYHEGFLGHSYVGAWVNLAAGTHTSDLRCDYGPITMNVNGVKVETGQQKVGAFIGDHTRTGLGVLFNTGSMVGVGCLLLPSGGFAPRCLPSFTQWSDGRLQETPSLEEQATTAARMMQRRGQTFTTQHQELFERIWAETGLERKQALRAFEQKRLRRSA